MEKANILLVDDKPGKLMAYEAVLADLGENLVLAKSGREALKYLLTKEVALILLDVVMPEMDGFETATLIREHPRLLQVPIIFVTAYSMSEMDRLKGYGLGAVDYVFAPIIPDILRAKVSVFIELYRKRQELQNLNRTLEERVMERTVQLEEVNVELEAQIREHRLAEQEIMRLNADLEQRVLERTGQLNTANQELQSEIAERRKAEAKFRGLLAAAPDAMVIVDEDARIVLANSRTEELFGYQRDELISKPVQMLVPARFRERYVAHAAGYLTKPSARPMGADLDLHGLRKNGTEFPVEIRLSPVRTEEGVLVISAIRDITERKKSEEMRSLMASIVESTDDAIIGRTLDDIIISWNSAAEDIFGYTAKEILGKSFSILVPPDSQHELARSRKKIQRDEQIVHQEAVRIRKDGRSIDVAFTASPIKDAAGAIVGISAIIRDITDSKRAEEALTSQSRILQSILDSMADAVIVVDADGKLMLFNPAAEQIHAIGPASAKRDDANDRYGLYLPDMVRPYPDKELPLARVLRGEVVDAVEMFVRHPKIPKGIWLSANARPLKSENGILQGGVAVIRDITENKLSEVELRNSREQLRNLLAYLQSVREEERSHIAREIHDELGQALTALKMDVSWLGKKLPADQDSLRQQAHSMLELIDSTMQAVQRISAELRPGLLDDLGLSTAIEWQVEQFRHRSRIECEITISPESIVLDRERSTVVFRIFQETLTNVARHSRATKVKVSLKKGEKKLFFGVRDNGVGIPKDRISNSKSFGLIGMRERVHPLGGRINIKSIANKGTIVFASIPLNDKDGMAL